jgi:Cu/Ag efflux protein CusF
MTIRLTLIAFLIAGFSTMTGLAQQGPRGRSYTIHGTVEWVNQDAQRIRVHQEKIEGYSDARIATYNVEDAAVLKQLDAGDRIDATVFEKDDTLYNIHVVVTDDRLIPLPRR